VRLNVNEIMSDRCIACGGDSARSFVIPETMFRTGEEFLYRECRQCESLQIASVPDNLSKYYDRLAYYSFNNTDPLNRRPWLTLPLVPRVLTLNTLLYISLGVGRGPEWTRAAGLRLHDRILDLGCGDGHELKKLHFLGYKHLIGADPFLPEDTWAFPGVPLLACRHDQVEGTFDCIVMHHAFEHVPDPHATLASVRSLLNPQGRLVIRMPVKDCYAWDTYGVNWVQLDAPRHLVLYTRRGFDALLRTENFTISRLEYDSYAFQFWGSELVRRGVPHVRGPRDFSATELRDWERKSQQLNRISRGDSVLAVATVAAS
jgi:SAM-dependent methyltransferase